MAKAPKEAAPKDPNDPMVRLERLEAQVEIIRAAGNHPRPVETTSTGPTETA